MSLGYRIFFVQGEEVHRISQKRFNSFFLRSEESLPEFADQTITSVLIAYELVARKPDCIVRIDTQKIRFDDKGFADKAYEREGMRLIASKMDDLFGSLESKKCTGGSSGEKNSHSSIVDAGKRFDERRWNQRHPELSGSILNKILTSVFGPTA